MKVENTSNKNLKVTHICLWFQSPIISYEVFFYTITKVQGQWDMEAIVRNVTPLYDIEDCRPLYMYNK